MKSPPEQHREGLFDENIILYLYPGLLQQGSRGFHAILAGHTGSTALEVSAGAGTMDGAESLYQRRSFITGQGHSGIKGTACTLGRSTAATGLHGLQQILAPECGANGLSTVVHVRRLTEGGKGFFSSVHNEQIIIEAELFVNARLFLLSQGK